MRGVAKHGYRVLQVVSSTIPNAIATVLLRVRDQTGTVLEIYLEWAQTIRSRTRSGFSSRERVRSAGHPGGATRHGTERQAPARGAREMNRATSGERGLSSTRLMFLRMNVG